MLKTEDSMRDPEKQEMGKNKLKADSNTIESSLSRNISVVF